MGNQRFKSPRAWSDHSYGLERNGLDVTNRSQFSINARRFSNKSPRRYAASVLFRMVWFRAISHTSPEKLVRSDAQSRNVDLNPWPVTLNWRCIRRSAMRNTMFESGFLAIGQEKHSHCRPTALPPVEEFRDIAALAELDAPAWVSFALWESSKYHLLSHSKEARAPRPSEWPSE